MGGIEMGVGENDVGEAGPVQREDDIHQDGGHGGG
jgi:hypothetical protein